MNITPFVCGGLSAYMLAMLLGVINHAVTTPVCRIGGRDNVVECVAQMDWWYGWLWWALDGWLN